MLVLDEVETLQRVRSDVREKSLNAMRQLIDEIDGGRFPGLYLVITGTPAFYDGPQGVQRLAPLAQRLHTTSPQTPASTTPARFRSGSRTSTSNGWSLVGVRVRDIYAEGREHADRLRTARRRRVHRAARPRRRRRARRKRGHRAAGLSQEARIDVLDKVDEHADFDPRRDYALTVDDGELTLEEREARTPRTADDVALDV